jgi:hypothetical protein
VLPGLAADLLGQRLAPLEILLYLVLVVPVVREG